MKTIPFSSSTLFILLLSLIACQNDPPSSEPINPGATSRVGLTINNTTDVIITSADVNPCVIDEVLDWEYIVNTQLGVSGKSPNDLLRTTSLRKFGFVIFGIPFGLNNWIPLLTQKACGCGTFALYRNHKFGSNELDWNIFVEPQNQFLQQAVTLASLEAKEKDGFYKDWEKNPNRPGYVVEGEITAYPDFRTNAANLFFPVPFDASDPNEVPPEKIGTKICLYGPIVKEKLHNDQPEVHPTELIWLREGNQFHLMMVQDASNRFGNKDLYKGDKSNPWKPWITAPMKGTFKIPFKIDLNANDIHSFQIGAVYRKHEIRNAASLQDDSNNLTHNLVVDGKVRAIISEPPGYDNAISVDFVDFCKQVNSTSNNTLLGYLEIAVEIGEDVEDKEGVFALQVDKTIVNNPDNIPPQEIDFSTREPSLIMTPVSYRPEFTNNKQGQIIADYQLDNKQVAQRLKNMERIGSFLKLEKFNSKLIASADEEQVLLQNFPLERQKEIFGSQPFFFRLPERDFQLTVIEDIEFTDKQQSEPTPAAQKEFRQYNELGESTELPMVANDRIRFRVAPYYCPSKDGDCEREVEDYHLEGLNDWLEELEGSVENVRITWDFKATHLPTGRPIKVNTSPIPLTRNGVTVRTFKSRFINDNITITFPRNNQRLIELVDIATVTDNLGNTGTKEFVFYSHESNITPPSSPILSVIPIDYLKNISEENGINYEEIFAPRIAERKEGTYRSIYKEGSSVRPDQREIMIQGVLNYYDEITEDQHLEVYELQGLGKGLSELKLYFER